MMRNRHPNHQSLASKSNSNYKAFAEQFKERPTLTFKSEIRKLDEEYCYNKPALNLITFRGRPDERSWLKVNGTAFRNTDAGTWLWRLIPQEELDRFLNFQENFNTYEDKIYIKEMIRNINLDEEKTIEIIDSLETFINLYEKGGIYQILHNTHITKPTDGSPIIIRKKDTELCFGKPKRRRSRGA